MLRADMDALPIAEETGLPYASQVMVANAALEDAQEGMCALLEKRAPSWRGA